MTQKLIDEIKDETFELEGLLQLLENRSDLPDTFTSLIVAKSQSILTKAILLQEHELTAEKPAQETPIAAENSAAEKPAQETTISEEKPDSEKTGAGDRNIRLALNDRFRFARECFGGNMALLDSTVKFVETLPDWDDAEDYFFSDLGWDPADSSVSQFLDILHYHFNNIKQ